MEIGDGLRSICRLNLKFSPDNADAMLQLAEIYCFAFTLSRGSISVKKIIFLVMLVSTSEKMQFSIPRLQMSPLDLFVLEDWFTMLVTLVTLATLVTHWRHFSQS